MLEELEIKKKGFGFVLLCYTVFDWSIGFSLVKKFGVGILRVVSQGVD